LQIEEAKEIARMAEAAAAPRSMFRAGLRTYFVTTGRRWATPRESGEVAAEIKKRSMYRHCCWQDKSAARGATHQRRESRSDCHRQRAHCDPYIINKAAEGKLADIRHVSVAMFAWTI